MNHPAAGASWVPASPCTPEVCVGDAARGVGIVRRVVRCAACVTLVVAGVAVSPLVARVPRSAARDGLIRGWARLVVRALGVRIRVKPDATPDVTPGRPGASPDRSDDASGIGELLVANHISWLDIAVLTVVRPARMVAKREVGQWPVLGRFVARGGTVFVARDRPRALPGDIAAIAGALRSGSPVGVFPEGSTWCGERQGTFRRAVFQAALDAGAAVRPVAITYLARDGRAARAPAFVGEDTLAASLWRVAGARGVAAEARVMRPIPPGQYADRRELAGVAQDMVAAAWVKSSRVASPLRQPSRQPSDPQLATTVIGTAPVHQLGAAPGTSLPDLVG